ncbi:MAG: hypothetical protein KAI47_20070, partial [Deltaproteobacteria bacterium]|nr:hypothetical protein [Deltaproteobacteria bacterium]
DLRRVGARCLGLDRADDRLSDAAMIVALIRDYMDLRSSDPESDIETVLQLLRTGGADSLFLDALTHAVDRVEGRDQRTERRNPGVS